MSANWFKKLAAQQPPLRPPGAIEEARFEDQCIRCRQCEQVCPYGSIRISHGAGGLKTGLPVIYARQTPCYLCMECPPVCPSHALLPLREKEKVKMGLAVLRQDTCLPYNGIICRACFERCPIYRKAITLKDELFPVVHESHCTGCGICEHVCPTEPASIVVNSAHFPAGA
ncbi:MAG: 4Fe-4S dicluster domain-containing protein [Calditrichia bacterium]